MQEGESGYFARTEDEWAAHLERLLSAPAERRRCGAAGRARIEQRYSTQGNAERFLAALAEAQEGACPGP
jgi:glycosyltransferase involved in cell wall biosynthesis